MNAVHASRYEQNLVRLIQCLRKDYTAPNAKFALATGCGNPGRAGLGLQVAEAQLAVGDAKKHPEFLGNVKAVDSDNELVITQTRRRGGPDYDQHLTKLLLAIEAGLKVRQ